ALGLQDTERLADDGAGDLEALADLLRHQRAVGTEVSRNDHLPQLLDELAVQSASAAAPGAPPHTAELRVRGVPSGCPGAAGGGRLAVGVAVDFARAREAGVCGAGGGHHGVRKGTHASFVGVVSNSLEVFGEKHTKG